MYGCDLIAKCAIIGDSGVGKTTLTQQFAGYSTAKIFLTIAIEFETKIKTTDAGNDILYQISDTR